jgi:hypothetical protein
VTPHTPRPTPSPTFNLEVKVQAAPVLVQPEAAYLFEPLIPPTLSATADIAGNLERVENFGAFGDVQKSFCVSTADLPGTEGGSGQLIKRIGKVLKWLGKIKVCYIAIRGHSGIKRRSSIQADFAYEKARIDFIAKLEFDCPIPLYSKIHGFCPPDQGFFSMKKNFLDVKFTHPINFVTPSGWIPGRQSEESDEFASVSMAISGDVKLERPNNRGTVLDLTVSLSGTLTCKLTGILTKVTATGTVTGSAVWKSINPPEIAKHLAYLDGRSWYDEEGSSWNLIFTIGIAFSFRFAPQAEAKWSLKCTLSLANIADVMKLPDSDWIKEFTCTTTYERAELLEIIEEVVEAVVDTTYLFIAASVETGKSGFRTAKKLYDGVGEFFGW